MVKITVAAGIIQNPEGHILMLAHNKTGLWTIPLGKVEYGEKIRDGLLREMKEEVGIDVVHCQVVDKFVYPFGKVETKTYVYSIDTYKGVVTNMEPDKHAELRWMTLNEIIKLPVTHATKGAIEYMLQTEKTVIDVFQ